MGTAGLIYAAIVAVWAAYLVPLWLRRHDEESAHRSAERFSAAMRVLARRQQSASTSGSATASGHLGGPDAGDVWAEDAEGAELGPYEFAPPGPTPATRRRRVLVGLLAVSTVFAGLAAINLVPWWTWYVSLVVAGGFVGLSAWIASGERATAVARFERFQRYRDEVRYADATPGVSTESASEPGMAPGVTPGAAASAAYSPATATTSDGSDESAREHSEQVVAVLPDDFGKPPQVREDGTWDPVEVPLPTYVTKNPAPRTSRKIEIGDAPEHRSLLDETQAGQPATTGIRDELYDREQTGDFDDLRAVND